MYALHVVCVHWGDYLFLYTEWWDRSSCSPFFLSLSLSLSPTPSPTTNKMHIGLSSTIRSVPATQSHTWSYLHIYPPRINCFQKHKSKAILHRGHNSWQALHRIWTMNYAEHTQTSRVFSGQQWLDVKMHKLGDVYNNKLQNVAEFTPTLQWLIVFLSCSLPPYIFIWSSAMLYIEQ